MAAGRHIPPGYEGLLPAAHHFMDPLPHGDLESKIGSQIAEIERLATDNHTLSSTHVALRQDLAAVHEEIEKLVVHSRSIRTESDIQIRVIWDKIAKKEGEIQASDIIKKDLQQSLNEAQQLVITIQGLSDRIKHSTEGLEKARLEVQKFPEMQAELEKLQQEHQLLRNTFEFAKGLNTAKVEEMKLMEIDLVGKSKEVERLKAEVSNALRRAQAIISQVQPYIMYPTPRPPICASSGYGRPHTQITGEGAVPYGTAGTAPVGPGVGDAAARPPNSELGQ